GRAQTVEAATGAALRLRATVAGKTSSHSERATAKSFDGLAGCSMIASIEYFILQSTRRCQEQLFDASAPLKTSRPGMPKHCSAASKFLELRIELCYSCKITRYRAASRWPLERPPSREAGSGTGGQYERCS